MRTKVFVIDSDCFILLTSFNLILDFINLDSYYVNNNCIL